MFSTVLSEGLCCGWEDEDEGIEGELCECEDAVGESDGAVVRAVVGDICDVLGLGNGDMVLHWTGALLMEGSEFGDIVDDGRTIVDGNELN